MDKKFIGSQGHLLLLYNLGKVYWKTNNTDKLSKKIKDIDELISNETNIIDIAYLNYLKSEFLYLRKDYNNSISYLNKSIDIIRKNDDYVNEHVGYLYLGKNLWQLNKKEEAIKYFEKVDSLFKKKKFLNYELREAYDYLIQYYKEDKNIEKQLEYTESLISLNKQFENEQKSLTNTLHYEYETKKLEESKAQLSKQLDYNNKVIVIIIILAVLFIIISIKFGIRQKKENKILRDKFDHLIKELDNESIESSNNQKNSVSKIELTPTEVKISKFLKVFELEKKYLLPIKLEDMVDDIGVSKTTLSQYFNNYKDGFNNYINDLRINEVLIDLKENENLREMSIEILSKKYGYNNSKTFFNQFKKITGIPPTYYIKQLNETINL